MVLATRYRKLSLKHAYLKLEVEELQEEFSRRTKAFKEAFETLYNRLTPEARRGIDGNSVGQQQERTARKEGPLEEELKSLYKAIAKETHPDKHALLGSEEQAVAASLFKEAKRFYDTADWEGLAGMATDLGLETPSPSDAHVEYLEERIRTLEEELKQIVTTVAWQWADLDSDARSEYMKQYVEGICGVSVVQ